MPASTPGTMRSRAAISIRSRAAARPSARGTSGGSRTRWTPLPCRRPRGVFLGRHNFRSFTDDDPEEKSTIVQLEVRRPRRRRSHPGPRARFALPLEDGAAHGRSARQASAAASITPEQLQAWLASPFGRRPRNTPPPRRACFSSMCTTRANRSIDTIHSIVTIPHD